MTQRIKKYMVRLSVLSMLLVPTLSTAAVGAQTPLQDGVCGGARSLRIDEPQNCDDPEAQDNVNNIITTVIDIFSAVVGVIAVIMILFGGFRYITAGGDSSKITSAQHTIIYAIVGLVVVALAQIIVRFVLFRAVVTG